MPNLYIEDDLEPEFIPDPQGTNWGWIGDIPYLWIKLDQISFEWTFLANNMIEMPNFYFGDDLDPEFISKLIPGGPTGNELWKSLIFV